MGGPFWSEGINKVDHQLVQAVNEALMVLAWFENLPKEEIPPRHLWHSVDMLDQWFEDVGKRRKRQASGKKSTYDTADEVPSMGNQLVTEDLRQ